MIYLRTRLLLSYALVVCLAPVLVAGELAATGGQQLLLLRNGQALEGKISRSGDIYQVALPDGVIRIKAADVEMVCRDFEEGYQRKRAAIQIGSLRDHLELAQWCQRHKLFERAAAELADAAVIAPKNPLVGLMQRQMQMALAPPPAPPKEEIAREQSPSNEELDRLIRGLPREVVENFTQSVQPLLLNNCTTAGCHAGQSGNGLHLERAASGQPVSRRATQRNLYAVLQFVDRDHPLSSRLLTLPVAAHGTSKTPIFNEKEIAQYKRLVDWVVQLGPESGRELPGGLDANPFKGEAATLADSPANSPRILSQDARRGRSLSPLHRAGPVAGSLGSSWMDNPAAEGVTTNLRSMPGLSGSDRFENTLVEPSRAAQTTYEEPISTPVKDVKTELSKDSPRAKIKRGASLPQFVPKDAFDADIFNRRFSASQNPEKADSTPSPAADK